MRIVLEGLAVWTGIAFILWLIRPNSKVHRVLFSQAKKGINVIACILTIIACVVPMKLSPVYNGDIVTHRNQYEVFAESLINGKLYFDYEVDDRLLEMDNPYDHDEREALDIDYHWDHAFYNGKYYMYFGVVPAVLVFVPFKLITGVSLRTYHATQIFVTLLIIGLFKLFKLIASKFFREMTNSVFIFTFMAFSVMSVWYFVDAPALYCTAISAGVCFEIWSFYFFFMAIFATKSQGETLMTLVIGSLLGALTFGCRPTVALANLILIPVLIAIVREKRFEKHVPIKLLISVIPYAVIGTLLMWYNYARFGSVFEFGQSYQLTVTDQSNYGSFLSHVSLGRILEWLSYYFLTTSFSSDLLSYGVFITYPVIALSAIWIFKRNCYNCLKQSKLRPLVLTMIITLVVIIAFSSTSAPYPVARYRTDVFWLIAIIAFIFIGFEADAAQNKRNFSALICNLMCLSMAVSFVLFWVPFDHNFTACENLSLDKLLQIISFGLI